MQVRYELNGQNCNPLNRDNIYLQVNHDQESIIDKAVPHVGISNLFFGREDILKIMAALNTSPGITEGVPFNIKITEGSVTETINMYINLMEGFSRSNDGITASVKLLQSLDWLDERVDGFTLESMYNEPPSGTFQIDGIPYSSYQDYFDKRCIYIPYVLSTIPNYQDIFTSIFSCSYCIIELARVIKTITQWAAPAEGFGVVVMPAQLALEVTFAVLLIASLFALIIHLFNCLIQPIKYHGAMLMVDMLKIVAHKTGLKLNSSIYETYPLNQLAYLPEKFNPIEDSAPATAINILGNNFQGFKARGFTSPGYATSAPHDSSATAIQKGYYNGTGGDLLRLAKKVINGKVIIPDGTSNLVLERRDYFPVTSPYQLPDVRQDWNGYNTSELTANIILKFLADLNDKNSINHIDTSGNAFYPGTILQATHQQISTVNPLLVSLKGVREIQIDAARGVRKDSLNFIEQLQQDVVTTFNNNQTAGLIAINVGIVLANSVIILIDYYIGIWNLLMGIVVTICNIINSIINTINDVINEVNNLGGSLSNISGNINFGGFFLPLINFIPLMTDTPFAHSFPDRTGALLLENDVVNTPKLLLVDINRPEFTSPGGYSGQQRIAYLNNDSSLINNTAVVNAKYLWDKFYFIDAFVGGINARRTKISPALNKPDEKNPLILKLADFNSLVSSPKFHDNFGEEVEADSIQWYIEKNGMAFIDFRKKGWLSNPQSPIGAVRNQEINLNLQINISLPNGQ